MSATAYLGEVLRRFALTPSQRDRLSTFADVSRLRDFDLVSQRLEDVDRESIIELSDAMSVARDEFIAFVERALSRSPDSPEWVNALEFDPGAEFSAAIERMLHRGWSQGSDIVWERRYKEGMPEIGEFPQSALRYFRTKRFWITGLVSRDLTREAQAIILQAMKSGEPLNRTVAKLHDAFGPYVARLGDTSEQVGARLRTIVRTNVTDAYNQGVLVDMRSPEMRGIVKAIEYVAILDERTTPLCEYLDGTWFRIGDKRLDALNPPNHFNCRSVLSPVIEGQSKGPKGYLTAAKFRRALAMIPPGFGGTR